MGSSSITGLGIYLAVALTNLKHQQLETAVLPLKLKTQGFPQ
jgi:hypothetical protein